MTQTLTPPPQVAEPAYFVVNIHQENSPDKPGEGDHWKVISFDSGNSSDENRESFYFWSFGWRRKFKCGTAFRLSYQEHGLCKWDLYDNEDANHHITMDWTRDDFDGVLVWESGRSRDMPKTFAERYKWAQTHIDQYTEWCNGNCISFWTYNNTEDEHDQPTNGIFYGSDNLAEEIQMEIDAALKHHPSIRHVFVTGSDRWQATYLHLEVPPGVELHLDVEDVEEEWEFINDSADEG